MMVMRMGIFFPAMVWIWSKAHGPNQRHRRHSTLIGPAPSRSGVMRKTSSEYTTGASGFGVRVAFR